MKKRNVVKKIKNDTSKDNKKGFIKKYVKLRTLIILVVLLVFNSYAWFVFATRVSGGLSAHVTSWNVTFKVVLYILECKHIQRKLKYKMQENQ